MMGLVLAPNLVQLFICWELVGLCSYLLIGYWYQRPEAARAAVKAFWITKAGDVGLLIGIVLLWRQAGTFDLIWILQLVDSGLLPTAGLGLITFCIYLGAVGKSAQFPLHVWLPDAMEGPTPVSALIHAATMVTAGVYLLTRTIWLFKLTPGVLILVGWVGAFTALLAAILACVQSDIKRVLAYSTVSQLGYMMAAIGAGFAGAGFLHLLTHGVFKALLFLGAGAVIHAVGTNDIFAMGGLGRRMPQTLIVFLVGTLSLTGIPFFAGFFSKEEVLGAVWIGGLKLPFLMLALAAFLTAFYMFRVVFVAFFGAAAPAGSGHGHGAADHEHGATHVHDAPALMTIPLWILALFAMTIGIGFAITHPRAEFEAPGFITPLAIIVALAGIVLAWLTYQRRAVDAQKLSDAFAVIRDAALRRFWLDDVFIGVYRWVILGFSRHRRLDRPVPGGWRRQRPERLDPHVRRPAAHHTIRPRPGLRLCRGRRRAAPDRLEPVAAMSARAMIRAHLSLGGGLDGPLRTLPQGSVARAKPALEAEHFTLGDHALGCSRSGVRRRPGRSVPRSSAGFAGATIPGGRFRKGGEAPLRVKSTPRVRPSGAALQLDPSHRSRQALPGLDARADHRSVFRFERRLCRRNLILGGGFGRGA